MKHFFLSPYLYNQNDSSSQWYASCMRKGMVCSWFGPMYLDTFLLGKKCIRRVLCLPVCRRRYPRHIQLKIEIYMTLIQTAVEIRTQCISTVGRSVSRPQGNKKESTQKFTQKKKCQNCLQSNKQFCWKMSKNIWEEQKQVCGSTYDTNCHISAKIKPGNSKNRIPVKIIYHNPDWAIYHNSNPLPTSPTLQGTHIPIVR